MNHRLLFQWPQKMPISPSLSVFISSALHVYRSHCLDPSTDPLVVVYKIPAQDQSGSKCLLRDIKAPKRLVHLLCSGVGQKRRTTTRRKTSLNSPPRLGLQPFILIPVDTCYFFDGKYKALLGNIRRAFDMRAQI